MITTIPNLLTLSRILVIPALIGAFYLPGAGANWVALILFVAAGCTDFLDGWLARRRGEMTKLGRFLDPVADKLLIAAAILMLVAFKRIDGLSVLAAVVILCREILVAGLREFLAELNVAVPVSRLAKWKTTVQIVAIAFLLAGNAAAPSLHAEGIGLICLWVAAILTLYTGYDYLRAGLQHMTEEAPAGNRAAGSGEAAREPARPAGGIGGIGGKG